MPSSDNRGWPQGVRSKERRPQLPQPIAAFSGTALLRAKLRGLLRGLFFPYQLSGLYFGQTLPLSAPLTLRSSAAAAPPLDCRLACQKPEARTCVTS